MKTLRLLLGDQLNSQHSWFDKVDTNVVYVMAEMRQETDYVKHHIQKVVAFFLSMRNFSEELMTRGHHVIYFKIPDANNPHNLEQLILDLVAENKFESFEYQFPDEYRLDEQLKSICEKLSIPTKAVDSEHFYTSRYELADFFKGKKQLLMESFYRMMRKKHDVLMFGDQPLDGKWNFDHNNRNQYKNEVPIPFPLEFHKNVSDLVAEITTQNITTIGTIDAENFNWPTSKSESLQLIDYFCEHLLAYFGTYQDALFSGHKFLFHSRLSFAMNSKMISPKEVVDAVISYYYQHQENIELAQVEGFVRQIIGWREYVRGIYWKEMPNYSQMNVLENYNPLPDFFWTGKTKMKCLQHSISQSLLAQLHPDAVDAWYLGVYIDAIEWVEMPNTRGMSQYADGGIVATKPYVSSGSYINKMSNYCGSCQYNVKDKLGENACPFNSLYWHFLDEKKQHFANNQRMSMMLALLRKMKPEELAATKEKAISILENIGNL
jgi:deoxyribodipyrimidine photolyase-related protein